MSDTCPHCGGEMVDDTLKTLTQSCLIKRCGQCHYWEELTFDDGTIVAVGHEEGERE